MDIYDRIAEFEKLLDQSRDLSREGADGVQLQRAEACEHAARELWEGGSAEDRLGLRNYFWDALHVDWDWLADDPLVKGMYGPLTGDEP